MISRSTFMKGLPGVTLAGLFASAIAFFIEPALRLRVKRWQIKRAGWAAAPLRIVTLSGHTHGGQVGCSIAPVRFGIVPEITMIKVSA